MMSTGIDSGGGASSDRAEKDISPHPITRTWSATDATSVLSTFTFRLSLIHFRHQRDAPKAGLRKPSHHLHHGTVVDLLVAPNKNTLVQPASRIGDRLQLRHQIVEGDFIVIEKDLTFEVDRKRQRILVLIEALGLGLRQVERHAHRQQRRPHHADDQQHQHYVDHRRDVDLRHHGATPAAASPAPRRTCHVHRHVLVLTMRSQYTAPHALSSIWRDRIAENSSANPSSRWACRFTSEVNLL